MKDWDVELQLLGEKYSPGYVITAFAVRSSIANEGYPGIHFVDTTESYLGKIGKPMIRNKVEKHMNRKLREFGLK